MISYRILSALRILKSQLSPSCLRCLCNDHRFFKHAFSRLLYDVGSFRAVKLAHPTIDARARIQHEYEMIQQVASQSLPVPKSVCQPLSDAQGVFGYRLELLTPLTLSELECRQDEVKNAINLFHEAGFCHGDLSMSNIMKDMHGDIRLIDFGFAGSTGHPVPSWMPKWVYQASPVLTTTSNLRVLAELFPYGRRKRGW